MAGSDSLQMSASTGTLLAGNGKCYPRGIPCQDPASNWTTRKPPDYLKEKQTEPHENHLTIVKTQKLKWYGHVSCSSGLAKTILQGAVNGGRIDKADRKRGRKTTIKEWTGLEFAKCQRAVENRERWRGRVIKTSMVPQRPPRLRGR